jgi:aromatic ring hydroxylase
MKHIFSKHGVPADIVSDRGKLFVSKFWTSLCHLLDIRCNHSTTYHPETDSQTEQVNQILEQYIRLYSNYQQDDWVLLLPLMEFAYNNTPHSATQVSPFFANKGYHLRIDIKREATSSQMAEQYAKDLGELHAYLREQVKIAIDKYA